MASIVRESVQRTASLNGTVIPAATDLIDSSGKVWTVSGGVIYKGGALAGYSKGVTKLLYDNNTIYQENSAGGWWSWNGNSWVSSSNSAYASRAWTAPTVNTDGTPLTDLAGYRISYRTNLSSAMQTIQLANPSAIGYVVKNLSAGTYYFVVAAYTTLGIQSSESSEVSKTIP